MTWLLSVSVAPSIWGDFDDTRSDRFWKQEVKRLRSIAGGGVACDAVIRKLCNDTNYGMKTSLSQCFSVTMAMWIT